MADASKPSSVLDGHLSRPSCEDRLPRHLGSGSRLSTGSANHLSRTVARTPRSYRRLLQGGLPFSLRRHRCRWGGIGHCCSRPLARTPVRTVRTCDRPCPRLHVAPCSAQLGLSSALRQRPSCDANLAQPVCRYNCRMGAVKLRLFRGRDSNPNLLIQSQLSYH